MASVSGEFSKSINNGYQQVIVKYTATTVDEDNKSNVVVDTYFKTVGNVSIGSRTNSTTIDGVSQSWSSSSLSGSGKTWKIGSVSRLVDHDNATGEKTISISSVFNIQATISGTYYSNITASKSNIVLPTIQRAFNFGVADADIGSSTTITINRPTGSSFTATIRYKATGQNSWTTIVDKTSVSSYSWTVPTSFYTLIPSDKQLICDFQVETYSGNNSIGIKTGTATFSVKESSNLPTINSVTKTDINSTTTDLTNDSSKMVKYASNVKVEVNATSKNSSYIKTIKVNGATIYTAPSQSPPSNVTANVTYNSANSNSFTVEVIDSRELPSTNTSTMTMINYIPLTIGGTIKRNQPTNNLVDINVSGNFWDDYFRTNEKNSLTVEYRYQESGAGSWLQDWTSSGVTITKSGNTYTASKQLSNMDYTKTYYVEVRAKDSIYLTDGKKTTQTVSKGEPVYWWNNNGFNVNGTLKASSNISTNNKSSGGDGVTGTILQSGSIEMSGSTPYIDFHYNNSTSDYTSRIIEESSGQLSFTGNVNAKTIQNMYGCSGTGTSSSTYVRLCNISFNAHTQGEFVGMKIYIGRGNNGTADQQAFIDLSMQLGWTGSNDGRFGCSWELHPMKTTFDLSNVNIIVIANSRTNYDIYLWTSVSYCKPYYVVNCAKSVTVTNYGTISTTAPSGTQCLIDKVLASFDSTTGTGIVTRSGGATLTSSTWRRFGNVVQLTIVINTTSSTNTGSNAFTGTINNSTFIPKIPINSSSYNGSTVLNCFIDASGNVTCRVLASNLGSGKELTIGFTYVI